MTEGLFVLQLYGATAVPSSMEKSAFNSLGSEFCLSHLLNSPGNFTAAKLAWVKENEPELFGRI